LIHIETISVLLETGVLMRLRIQQIYFH